MSSIHINKPIILRNKTEDNVRFSLSVLVYCLHAIAGGLWIQTLGDSSMADPLAKNECTSKIQREKQHYKMIQRRNATYFRYAILCTNLFDHVECHTLSKRNQKLEFLLA